MLFFAKSMLLTSPVKLDYRAFHTLGWHEQHEETLRFSSVIIFFFLYVWALGHSWLPLCFHWVEFPEWWIGGYGNVSSASTHKVLSPKFKVNYLSHALTSHQVQCVRISRSENHNRHDEWETCLWQREEEQLSFLMFWNNACHQDVRFLRLFSIKPREMCVKFRANKSNVTKIWCQFCGVFLSLFSHINYSTVNKSKQNQLLDEEELKVCDASQGPLSLNLLFSSLQSFF